MENFKDSTVVSWFKQQANITNSVLDKIPGRNKLIAEWKMLDKLQPPIILRLKYEGGRYF